MGRPSSRARSCINRNSQTALMGHKLRSAYASTSTIRLRRRSLPGSP
jgi:hypothetical protein